MGVLFQQPPPPKKERKHDGIGEGYVTWSKASEVGLGGRDGSQEGETGEFWGWTVRNWSKG